MTDQPQSASLERSDEEVRAARLLADGGFYRQAISRAYYAAFFAAEAALTALGESRSKHSAVIAAFGSLLVKPGGIASEDGRVLRSLFERRNQADYLPRPTPPEEADAAIADAERFVGAVKVWITLTRT